MYFDLETKISLLLITARRPVIMMSVHMINARAIRRCQIFGKLGFTRNNIEIKAAAVDTSLIKYLRPKIELL